MDDLMGTTVDLLLNWPMPIFSPIVVVASVTANEPAGPPVPAKRFAGLTLQLHRVDCILENSIKGNRPPDHFHFFYFADPELPGSHDPVYKGARLFRAKPGGRYIFFLFEELGNLRSVGDVGPFSAVVLSGRHKPGNDLTLTSPEDNHQLGRVITDILLTPGDGLDPASLSAGIDGAVIWSERFGNRLEIVRKLRELVKGPEPLRAAACGQLVLVFRSQYACLKEIAADPQMPEERRESYLKALAREEARDKLLEPWLRDPATLGLGIDGSGLIAAREELEILLGSPNPEIWRLTCVALRRYYPRSPAAQDCGKNAPSP